MDDAMSALTLLPNSSVQVADFSHQIIASVKGGVANPLQLKAQFKFIEKVIEKVDKEIKDEVLKECLKYGKSFEAFGFRVDIGETGTKYDYAHCGDPLWNDLDKMIKSLSEQKKDRETFLKAIKETTYVEVPDEATGEMVEVRCPLKSSTTSPKFTAI